MFGNILVPYTRFSVCLLFLQRVGIDTKRHVGFPVELQASCEHVFALYCLQPLVTSHGDRERQKLERFTENRRGREREREEWPSSVASFLLCQAFAATVLHSSREHRVRMHTMKI